MKGIAQNTLVAIVIGIIAISVSAAVISLSFTGYFSKTEGTTTTTLQESPITTTTVTTPTTTTTIPTTTTQPTTTLEIRKNCRELGGYLCNSEVECALPWLSSSESYCCPIECNTCTQEVLNNCKSDEEKCVKATCGVITEYKCEYEDMIPCPNNGICEPQEFGSVFSGCGSWLHYSSDVDRSDCPDTCNDGNSNTTDYYNYTTQRCEHRECDA